MIEVPKWSEIDGEISQTVCLDINAMNIKIARLPYPKKYFCAVMQVLT